MAYADVPDSDIDPKSPLKTGVLGQLRDNIVGLYEEMRAFKYKLIDETVNSAGTGSTLQNDSHLLFQMEPNQEWVIVYDLYLSTNTTADFKYQLTGPAGASGYSMAYLLEDSVIDRAAFGEGAVGAAVNIQPAMNVTRQPLRIYAFVRNGGNVGNLLLQWAQRVADPGDTTVAEGSHLQAWLTTDLAGTVPTTYTAVSDAEIDPDSDIVENLTTLIRDNPVHLAHEVAFAYKATFERVVGPDTTLQDDDDLTFTVEAGERWRYWVVLRISSPAAAGFRWQWSVPSIPSGTDVYLAEQYWQSWWEPTNAWDALTGAQANTSAPSTPTEIVVTASSATTGTWTFWVDGWFDVGATGGSVTLQWAQGTGAAGNTDVLANSFLFAQRMDQV